MEQSGKPSFGDWAKQPKGILILTACLLLLVNLGFFVWQLLPELAVSQRARLMFDQVREQLDAAVGQPQQIQTTDEEVDALVEQVPVLHRGDEVLVELRGFAAQTDVEMVVFRQASAVAAKQTGGTLEEQLQQLTDGSAAGGAAAASDTAPAASAADNGKTESGPFERTVYQLELTGSLSGLLNFFDLVAANEHLTEINTWSFDSAAEETGDEATGNEATENSGGSNVSSSSSSFKLNLSIAMYSVPRYAEVFGGAKREDTSIGEVLNDLQLKYPDIQPFRSVRTDEKEK